MPVICSERHERLEKCNGRPGRLWRVTDRNGNRSAFNGYHWQASQWSAVVCLRCGCSWRTKANYVDRLLDRNAVTERDVEPGYVAHQAFMNLNCRTAYR